MGWTFPDNEIDLTSLITYGAAWNAVDLSGVVPAGTKLVMLHVRNSDAGTDYLCNTRPVGSSHDVKLDHVKNSHEYFWAVLDANRRFEGYFANAALLVGLVASTTTGTYWTNPVVQNPSGAGNVWADRDVSAYIPANNSAAIANFGSLSRLTAFRPNGYTWSETGFKAQRKSGGSGADIFSLDAASIFEFWIDSGYNPDNWYLWGYNADFGWLTSIQDLTPTANNTWQDRVASVPDGAVAAVLALYRPYTTNSHTLKFRAKGSTDDLNYCNIAPAGLRRSMALVKLDGNKTFQAYTSDKDYLDLYVIGYVMEAGSGGITGTVDADLTPPTSVESGAVTINGTAAGQLAALIGAMSGAVKVVGGLESTLAALTSAEAGNVLVLALLEALLADLSAALAGDVKAAGQIAANLSQISALLSGNVALSGQVEALAGQVVSIIQGTVESSEILGTVAANLSPIGALLSGNVAISGQVEASISQIVAAMQDYTNVHYGWLNALVAHAFGLAVAGRPESPFTFPSTQDDKDHFEAMLNQFFTMAGDSKPNVLNADLLPFSLVENIDVWNYAPNYMMNKEYGSTEALVLMMNVALDNAIIWPNESGWMNNWFGNWFSTSWEWFDTLLKFLIFDNLNSLPASSIESIIASRDNSRVANKARVLFGNFMQDKDYYAEAENAALIALQGENPTEIDLRYGNPIITESITMATLLAERFLAYMVKPIEQIEVTAWLEGIRAIVGENLNPVSAFHGYNTEEFFLIGKTINLDKKRVALKAIRQIEWKP